MMKVAAFKSLALVSVAYEFFKLQVALFWTPRTSREFDYVLLIFTTSYFLLKIRSFHKATLGRIPIEYVLWIIIVLFEVHDSDGLYIYQSICP